MFLSVFIFLGRKVEPTSGGHFCFPPLVCLMGAVLFPPVLHRGVVAPGDK